jgi:hypothetical protein
MATRFMVRNAGLRGGNHRDAIALELAQLLGANGLDLGHDHVGFVLFDHARERVGIEHGNHFERIRHLHGGSSGVAIDGDHRLAQAFGGDDDFFSELSRAEEHDLFDALPHLIGQMSSVFHLEGSGSRPGSVQ